MDIHERDLQNIELSGIDLKDYPDFCDAYISYCEIEDRVATDNELDYINENFDELINRLVHEEVFMMADC